MPNQKPLKSAGGNIPCDTGMGFSAILPGYIRIDPALIMATPDNDNNTPDQPESLLSRTFLRCQASLKRYLARYLKNSHDIEDVVSEAFLRSYEMEQDKGRSINFPASYLYRTARNLALKQLSCSAHKLTDYIEELELTEVYTSLSEEKLAQSEEKFRFFCRAVENLPLQCRKVFILRKVYGFSHQEIADYLGISTSTVEKLVAKGMLRSTEYMRLKGYFDEVRKKARGRT